MDFTGIGKIGNFAKQKNLLYAANYKIKTGQSIVDSNGRLNFGRATMFNSVNAAKKTSNSTADQTRLASIKQKLRSGRKLSEAEMNYLREKDEKLYKKAKYAEEVREELKNELRAAKTKQEARQAVMRMTAKVAADASADFESLQGGGGGANISSGANVGSDISADMSSVGCDIAIDGAGTENLNVEGAENISGGEISNVATSENVDATTAETSATQIENSAANPITSDDDSDSAIDILDKYIYAIRAIQNEWMEFMKSDKYKDMPEDSLGTDEISHDDEINFKPSNGQLIDALFAYQKSMNYRLEV